MLRAMAKTTKTTAVGWARRVERWKRSGLTAAEFGAREGFDGKQLSWWKWHLSQRAAGETAPARPKGTARPASVTFVPARVVDHDRAPAADGRIEVVLGNGRVVRLTGGDDDAVLAQALRVAELGGT
jgi:transposase